MKKDENGHLSRNTKILSISSFLVDTSSEATFPLLPFFLTTILGAPVFVVGLMESLSESIIGVASVISGFYSDKIGKRKKIIVLGYGLSASFKMLLPFLTMWQQVVSLRVFERLGKGIRETPRDALIGLSETKKSLGRAFGFRKLLDNLGAIAGPLLATSIAIFFFNNVYTEQTYRTIFLVAVVPAVIAVIVLLFLKERPSATAAPQIAFHHIFSNRNVRNFIFVMSFLYLGNFSMMFFLLRANDYLPLFAVPIAYVAYNAAYTVFSLPAGIMADKIGAKKTVLAAMLVFLIALAGFAFFPSLIVIFLLFVLLGFFMATAKTVPQVFLVEHMKNNNYASAIGSYKGLTGLASLPANLIAGFLWTVPLFGAPATFVFSMAVACLAIVFLVIFVRDETTY